MVNSSVYEGKFKNSQYHGPGKITFSTGKVITGNFKNGELPEQGLIEYSNGDIFNGYIHEADAGKEGIMKYANGDIYRGSFSDGLKYGYGEFVYNIQNDAATLEEITSSPVPICSVYKGKWQQGKRFGQGKEYDNEQGTYFEGMFINDK